MCGQPSLPQKPRFKLKIYDFQTQLLSSSNKLTQYLSQNEQLRLFLQHGWRVYESLLDKFLKLHSEIPVWLLQPYPPSEILRWLHRVVSLVENLWHWSPSQVADMQIIWQEQIPKVASSSNFQQLILMGIKTIQQLFS